MIKSRQRNTRKQWARIVKRTRKAKEKRNTVTGSWVTSAGAEAALGSRRDVGRRRFVSEGRSNEAPGSKGYVYYPVDVTSLLFGASFLRTSSTAFIATASLHLRESILLEDRPTNEHGI